MSNPVFQLSIILYPPELFNEKFLIKMRDCFIKLENNHPLKQWIQSVTKQIKPTIEQVKVQAMLSNVFNSQFNLITDSKVKNQIINTISEIQEESLAEILLKSYLYLMIGNVTRSDNLLLTITKKAPLENWKGFSATRSFYEKILLSNLDEILNKMDKHPTDRKSFHLFVKYLKAFLNDQNLMTSLSKLDDSSLKSKLDLSATERLSPAFIHYLRLLNYKESNRLLKLKDPKFLSYEDQAYWIWPFMDVDSIISTDYYPELLEIEANNKLWFYYLVSNEKLMDLYLKENGKSLISGKRKYLRDQLENRDVFMLVLFKLIEIGDIDHEVVHKTLKFMSHE